MKNKNIRGPSRSWSYDS